MAIIDVIKGSNLHSFIKSLDLGYKKKSIIITILKGEGVVETQPNIGGWSGGSIDYDYLVVCNPTWPLGHQMSSMERISQPSPFGTHNTNPVFLNNVTAMITVGMFCGKQATMKIKCTQEFYDTFLNG